MNSSRQRMLDRFFEKAAMPMDAARQCEKRRQHRPRLSHTTKPVLQTNQGKAGRCRGACAQGTRPSTPSRMATQHRIPTPPRAEKPRRGIDMPGLEDGLFG